MTEYSSEVNPQILLNGEQHERQQDDAAALEDDLSPVGLDGECPEDGAAEKEAQAKMRSVFKQVRNQVRAQVGKKSSMMELVQKVKDMEMEFANVDSDPDGADVNGSEKKNAKLFRDDSKEDADLMKHELSAVFEKKLKDSQKALRDEFEQQISQVRRDMQAYTDHALKGLECKKQQQVQNPQQTHTIEQQERKGPDKKQKPSAAPSLACRRGRVLTRTMTTITPKTCAPVIIGPRAKSETLTSQKGARSRLLPGDPALCSPGNKPYQSRKPLPPACPPLHQRKKPVQPKAKSGN